MHELNHAPAVAIGTPGMQGNFVAVLRAEKLSGVMYHGGHILTQAA
jgi:hypothetical protein